MEAHELSTASSVGAEISIEQVADGRGAPDLAPDLVASLLVERGQVLVPRVAGDGDDRADVLLFPDHRPADGRRDRLQQPLRTPVGPVDLAETAQVDDVPCQIAVKAVLWLHERLCRGRTDAGGPLGRQNGA